MAMNKKEVSVQFLGWKDSTLVAALMCRQFEKVHLLTFSHSLQFNEDKTKINANKLKKMFGHDKIKHVFVGLEDLFSKIYSYNYMYNFKKYTAYLAGCFCGACRLSMVTHIIIYNVKGCIGFTSDGINKIGFDLSQYEWLIPITKNFCMEYGIDYGNPIYNIDGPDLKLLEMGITSDEPQIFYRNKPECGGGHFHNIYLRCYYLYRYGREAYEKVSIEWSERKIELYNRYIQNCFNNRDVCVV